MKKNILYLLILVLVPLAPAFPGRVYDIRGSGATGDGVTDNTIFIQKAIDSCAVTGGMVYVPEGVFMTATLVLKSNVTLHVSAKGALLGHTSPSTYPYQDPGIPFYGGEWVKQALIFCKGQENVSIEGSGIIDGQGAAFATNTLKKPDRYRNRPYLLWFAGCRNIRVSGVRLRNSAFWMQHYLGCERVVIDGIDVWNHSNKNKDMIDIDGCRYVMISNVNISLRNIQLTTPGGGKGVALQPVADEKEDAYPEATMFGKLPAHGFYISHATGIRLSGIQLHHRSDEKRPAFFFHDTEDFSLESCDIISRNKHTPLVIVNESRAGSVAVRSTKENILQKDKASQGVTLYK